MDRFRKTHKELEKSTCVGRKTANVVLAEVYGIPSIAVDTHVSRVSKRPNIAPEDASGEEIEAELMKKIQRRIGLSAIHRMDFLWTYICLAKNPKCRPVLFKVIVSIIKKQPRNKLKNVIFFGFLQL